MHLNNIHCSRSISTISIIFIILISCYSNTFNASWQFDDKPNITENYAIQIDNLRPETLWNTLFSKPFAPGAVERPVAFFTFAINWYFGKDNPSGYHLVNLLIHSLTAFFLFKSTLLLLHSNTLKYTENDAFFIALLNAILWAINPIQTQAVTYIVQRMASMAAMFFIFSVYQYIRARTSQTSLQFSMHCILGGLFFCLALGCKENAITLLPSLLLVEWLFFYDKSDRFSKKIISILIAVNIIFLLASFYYIISNDYLNSLFTPIENRPYSLIERTLTQPRIIVFYLSLLIFPSPLRLSLEHYFQISTSLTNPITTIISIIFIFFIIFISIWKKNKNILFSFAIFFFFINHLIESTIIPLELVFEHRNYLPSFFFFLPIAAGLRWSINYTAISSKLLHWTLIALIPLLLIVIGIGTYSRNAVWKTEESLWTDSLHKAPGNARPYARIAEIYGWQKEKNTENFNIAVALLKKSIDREIPRTTLKAALVNNIGKLYALKGQFSQAIEYYNQSIALNPDFVNSRIDLVQALIIQGNFQKALDEIEIVIKKSNPQSKHFTLKGIIHLWLNQPNKSVESFRQAMLTQPTNKESHFYNLGVALSRAGHPIQGAWFLKRSLLNFPTNSRVLYGLIENSILSGNDDAAQKYTRKLIEKFGLLAIKRELNTLSTDHLAVPINNEFIKLFIAEEIRHAVVDLERNNR